MNQGQSVGLRHSGIKFLVFFTNVILDNFLHFLQFLALGSIEQEIVSHLQDRVELHGLRTLTLISINIFSVTLCIFQSLPFFNS